MDNDLKKLQKLEQVLSLVDRDAPTSDEIAEVVEALISVIQNIKSDVDTSIDSFEKELESFQSYIGEQSVSSQGDLNELRGQVNELIRKISYIKAQKGDKGDKGDKGEDGIDGKDGEPADLEALAVTAVNYIETLEGDDRLDIKAIKGAETYTDEVKTLQNRTQLLNQIASGIERRVDALESAPAGVGTGDMLAATYDPATIEEQVVGLTATQTLTNKRLTSPKINEDVAVTATATELNYVDGVTSAIQTQLDAKLASSAYDDATAAETTTGTSTAKYVSPDGLAGSTTFGRKVVCVQVTDGTTDVATGDGKAYFTIPEALTGMNLVRAQATVVTAGTTNATTVMIHNKTDAADMLSGAISIASAGTVGTVGTVNGATDDVVTNDVIRIDVDSVSTTAPKGLMVTLEFQLP